ncbi:MAG: trypsin-like peptidase domain-containing protein [Ruminococcus sp.]|nr:trypsin-like peptidase domain-containing protein [Ruminococcus sp.]
MDEKDMLSGTFSEPEESEYEVTELTGGDTAADQADLYDPGLSFPVSDLPDEPYEPIPEDNVHIDETYAPEPEYSAPAEELYTPADDYGIDVPEEPYTPILEADAPAEEPAASVPDDIPRTESTAQPHTAPAGSSSGVVYDSFMYEPIGFDRRDREAAERIAAESAARERKLRARRERSVVVTFFILALCAIALAVYGIVADILRSGKGVRTGSGNRVILYQSSKPEGANALAAQKDEYGRYTTEGAAAAVRPSIVEIYTYTNAAKTGLEGTGSGVVISEDGYIVTNAHVLLPNGFHTVNTVDGHSYSASIVGRDSKTDIAVIKVNTDDLVPAVLGNSDEMIVGEPVIAIGNPAGLSSTVTDGIVSAVNRKIRSDSTGFQMDCIQTNAAISPGNSGGALVNMYGQVIGITSSKYVSSSYEGLGFAITINEARPIIEDLIKNGFIPGRFRVGITFIETSTDARRKLVNDELGFDMPEDFGGLYITAISEDCDIHNSDLKVGDFIYSIDDQNIRNYDQFNEVVTASYGPGDKVKAKCAHLEKDGSIEYYEIEFKLMEDTSGDF